MDNNRYCVIMAGGTGNRFWPVSRDSKPKQFLDFTANGQSFIKRTFDRFTKLVPKENILVVSLSRYKSIVLQQLPDLLPENLLLEPYSRNTAPCITFATCTILKRNPNAVMAASPADHAILNEEKFTEAMNIAFEYAEKEDALMTIGIVPDKPETDYGYIQVTGKDKGDGKPLKVKTFTEKPDKSLAEVFYNSGEFYWNSGIFAWKASAIMKEMKKYIPDIISLFNGWETALGSSYEKEFLEKVYSDCPKISIDYGVMEKTDHAMLVPGHFIWSDLDGWDTLYKVIDAKDRNGNLVISHRNLFQNTKNSLSVSLNKNKLYVLKGLENFMVIDTDDALLICPRTDKDYKDIISDLGMPDYEDYR